MNLELTWDSTPQLWRAHDLDTADGAEDSGELAHMAGTGPTKELALFSLVEKLDDYWRGEVDKQRELKIEHGIKLGEATRALSEAQKRAWVSVEERIPTDDSTVIICTNDGYRGPGWWDDRKDGGWMCASSGASFVGLKQNVTHWVPLPEAPK